ncbi:HalOD1 output domain-containing protein [Haloarculaceae archaeon H-GB2-1]|nr:hypothetical protein [Haloarculaceae archaeon H-GB1-1]MEA5389471.1 HalOD1 output domain-containing protein [Haloarculaceae archaeon H-GB11]MEA5410077.1 HalOD1 output domain-containing protein [Haloarculaceae archaeon H-GB2-1]
MQGNTQHATHGTTRRTPSQYYHTYHDFGGSAHISTTIIHALADIAGVDVTETEFTLNDYVDPSALDRLFSAKDDGTPRIGGTLSLVISGYHVTVYADGQIIIQPPHQQSPT